MGEEKKGFFARLKEGLTKTRNNIVHGIDAIFSGFSEIDEDFYEELEEILIMGDLGVNATSEILERLKAQVRSQGLKKPEECRQLLIDSIREQMDVGETAYDFEKEQSVVLVIGVNGVGKTTSVGKLAALLKGQGRKVLIAAADTFRAAAGSPCVGVALKDLPTLSDVLVTAIIRDGRCLITGGSDEIRSGDSVLAVTTRRGMARLEDILRG